MTYLSTVDVIDTVHAFVYREARYADEGAYSRWLDLWASEDILYWVSPREDLDPAREVSFIYDDRAMLEQRVARWNSGFAWAQIPRSLTSRIVGNVEIDETSADLIQVRANVHVVVVRKGSTTFLPERVSYQLRSDGGELRIVQKKVVFLDGDAPVGNITFVL